MSLKLNPFTGTFDIVSGGDLSGLVPYTGATANVDIGTHEFQGGRLSVSSSGTIGPITSPNWSAAPLYMEDSLGYKMGIDGTQQMAYCPIFYLQNAHPSGVFVWETNGSSTDRMTLSSAGLSVAGNITGTNLSGTNTGDQDLSAYAPIATPTFTGGQVTVSGGTGPSNLLIVADSDNVTETDVATLSLSQDGGLITGSLGFNSSNYLVLDNTGVAGNWGVGFARNGTIGLRLNNDGSSTATGTFTASNFSGSSSGTNTGDQDLSPYAKLDDNAQTIIAEQFKSTGDVAITYDGDFIDTVTIGSRVITFSNDGSDYTSWSDSVNTWTPTYTDGQLTGVAVT